jgi:hypothetical protein
MNVTPLFLLSLFLHGLLTNIPFAAQLFGHRYFFPFPLNFFLSINFGALANCITPFPIV